MTVRGCGVKKSISGARTSSPPPDAGSHPATVSAVASGHPKRIARRAKNIVVGRALSRAGFWRWLWK